MESRYEQLLHDVLNDRRSGASQIARKTVVCLEQLLQEMSGESKDDLLAALEQAAESVLKAQPAMAQLTHFFNSMFTTIESESDDEVVVLARKLGGVARRFYEHCENAVSAVAGHGAGLVENDSVVFTHSHSSTIVGILRQAREAGKTFDVLLTESRPMLEGQTCAQELSAMGIACTYFVDAAFAKAIDRADLVFLGADSVSEHSLINKIGSRAVCLLAREAVVPCYAACESSKFIARKLGPKREQPRDPGEVWADPPPETTVENYYFDEVALDLFTGVITEDGVLTPEDIAGRIRAQPMSPRLLKMLK